MQEVAGSSPAATTIKPVTCTPSKFSLALAVQSQAMTLDIRPLDPKTKGKRKKCKGLINVLDETKTNGDAPGDRVVPAPVR